MSTSYTGFAKVRVVLTVAVADLDAKVVNMDEVRQLVAMAASEAVTKALKEAPPPAGVNITNWPEAEAIDVSINWQRDR